MIIQLPPAYTTTFVTTLPIMLAKPDLPHRSFAHSLEEPSRKRECSGFSYASLSHNEMWDLIPALSGHLVSDRKVGSSHAVTLQATPLALQGPGCCHQHGGQTSSLPAKLSISGC